MAVNIVIADEFKLIRKGIKSMIMDMNNHYPGESYNVIDDTPFPDKLISIIKKNTVDLIIFGYSLKINHATENNTHFMDGYAFISWLTRNHPTIKIIVMSPYKHVSLARKSLESGAMGYFSRDICEKTLWRAIHSAVNNEIYVEQDLMKELCKNSSDTQVSPKENEVLRLLCKGLNLSEIAKKMNISIKTVSAHKIRAMNKLGVKTDCHLFFLLSKINFFDISF